MKRSFSAKAFSNWIYNWYRESIRHPKYRWWIILGTLVYLLDPFDLSPDMLPVIGWLDDGVLATVLVTEVAQLIGDRWKVKKSGVIGDG
jgi:uncharacterized membrane protein YkvA (DUF1232 family)